MKSFKPVGALVGALLMFGALAGASVASAAKAGPRRRPLRRSLPGARAGRPELACVLLGCLLHAGDAEHHLARLAHRLSGLDRHDPGRRQDRPARPVPARAVLLAYDLVVLGVIRGHLYDSSIKPDTGSTNPFLPGANRTATHRSYTVTVVDQPDPGPGHEAPNTLYGGIAGQAPGAGPMLIVERVYLPDQGRDFSGGVGEPAASYVAADGTIDRSGRLHRAADQGRRVEPDRRQQAPVPAVKDDQHCWRLSSSPEHPAVAKPVWYKYFTPQWLLAPYLRRNLAGEPDRKPARSSGPASGRTRPTGTSSPGWTGRSDPTATATTSPCSTASSRPPRPPTPVSRRCRSGTTALLVDLQQRRADQRQDDRALPRRRGGADQRSARVHRRGQPPAGPSHATRPTSAAWPG